MASSGVVFLVETVKPSGTLLITVAHPCGGKQGELKYRPVAFDAAGKRYALKQDTGGSSTSSTGEGAALGRFHLDPGDLSADQVKDLGVEVLKPEGRNLAAAQGQQRAKTAGVEVLPLPEVGRAFDFALTTMDGKKVRSDELRGKVILIDWWASWCAPCIAKMPELKELYESHHKDGLEVVGVCFDEDAGKAQKTIKRLGLIWPQVLVPSDEKARDVWQEATDLRSLPRLLLIDRKGVLRAECTPQDMEEQITKLLNEKPAKD
jgi:peroxiredoxin